MFFIFLSNKQQIAPHLKGLHALILSKSSESNVTPDQQKRILKNISNMKRFRTSPIALSFKGRNQHRNTPMRR